MPIPVLLISAGILHPSLLARFALERRLARSREFSLYHSRTLEELPRLDWSQFSALVLFFHSQKISANALTVLDDYTHGGGGLLAVHSASASFQNQPGYQRLLGGRFTGHGPVEKYRVEPDPAHHDIFGVAAPFLLQDELYTHEWDADNQVHFWVKTPSKREPLVWTRFHGQGKVCYCAAGHTVGSFRSPQVAQILIRGLRWVATES